MIEFETAVAAIPSGIANALKVLTVAFIFAGFAPVEVFDSSGNYVSARADQRIQEIDARYAQYVDTNIRQKIRAKYETQNAPAPATV